MCKLGIGLVPLYVLPVPLPQPSVWIGLRHGMNSLCLSQPMKEACGRSIGQRGRIRKSRIDLIPLCVLPVLLPQPLVRSDLRLGMNSVCLSQPTK